MNQDKAREFFSAYYEGSLDAGLRQTMDQRLRNDGALKADYAAFVETMKVLDHLSGEDVEIPIYLSDRVATRLEQERERNSKRFPVLSLWVKGLMFTGLAAAAVVSAFLSFGSKGPVAGAGIVDSSPESSQPTFSGGGSTVSMSFRPHDERMVVVSSAISGREVQRFTVNASTPSHPFENRLSGTALFRIDVPADHFSTLLAVPGVGGGAESAGSGTVRDFAVALAGRYHVPVLLKTQDDQKRLAWKLSGSDAREAANSALKDLNVSVDERSSGILNLSDR